jgi:hypothetical protein
MLFFLLALGTGYTISWLIMTALLDAPLRLYGFINLSLVALLIAVLLLIWLDRPFELKLFDWPEPQPKTDTPRRESGEPDSGQITALEGTDVTVRQGAMFPHEAPSDHWNVDFGNGKQVYQGSDLPIWLLAGWATFIIWAVVYLVAGLPTAF